MTVRTAAMRESDALSAPDGGAVVTGRDAARHLPASSSPVPPLEPCDHRALAWIGAELNSVIGQARDALGEHAAGGGDPAALALCEQRLHQARATLRLIELYGASLLAEEMELLAGALRRKATRQPREATEILMLASIRLPDYLEKLRTGGRDLPLLVLPLLNELRAARDAELLSEAALPIPGLDLKLAAGPAVQQPTGSLAAAVRRVRPAYQRAFLAWYRDAPAAQGLDRLGSLLDELARPAGGAAASLFRIAAAAVAALACGAIAPGIAIKRLFGRLDGELRRILQEGEAVVAEDPPRALMKDLLYYLAHADTNQERVVAIRAEFGLDALVPDADEIAAERAHLAAPGRGPLAAFGEALQAELTRIRDALEFGARRPVGEAGGLAALERSLRKVGDTLGIIGQGALRARLQGQADRLQAQAPTEEAALLGIAGDLLRVQQALARLLAGQSMPAVDAAMARLLAVDRPGAEDIVQGQAAGIREAGVELLRIKEALADFLHSPQDLWILSGVRRHVRALAGALRLLERSEAAALLTGIGDAVATLLSQPATPPGEAEAEALADAVMSSEYYLEAVAEGASDPRGILETGFAALRRLGWEPVREGVAAEPVAPFVEAARGELVVLRQSLERWDGAPDDRVALACLCRGFHVLAGGGERAGAHVIGELAGALGALLDRVLERTAADAPWLPALRELLADAVGVLPGLIDLQAAGEPPAVDLEPLLRRAAMLRAEAVAPPLARPLLYPEPEAACAFLDEAPDLLEALEAALRAWRREPAAGAPVAELQRILHTLKGGARIAGMGPIGDLTHDFESLLAGVRHGQAAATPELFALAQHVVDRLVEQVEEGRRVGQASPARELSAALDAWLSGEPGAVSAAEPLPAEPFGEDAAAPPRREQLRVDVALLDRLRDETTALALGGEGLRQAHVRLDASLGSLGRSLGRLGAQLRQLEQAAAGPASMPGDRRWSPLLQTIGETAGELVELHAAMAGCVQEGAGPLREQARGLDAMQALLRQACRVEFAQLVPRLQRVVRQTCGALGKEAELVVAGGGCELARGLLERLTAPLEHLLRNAVCHGIESPAARRAAGKSSVGRLELALEPDGDDLRICVTDDGAGLDLARIRARAVALGLLAAQDGATEAELTRLVFAPGFSTATEVSQLAGRGMGLDVVVDAIEALGGEIEVRSEAGRGTCFEIRLTSGD